MNHFDSVFHSFSLQFHLWKHYTSECESVVVHRDKTPDQQHNANQTNNSLDLNEFGGPIFATQINHIQNGLNRICVSSNCEHIYRMGHNSSKLTG